jgi:hypothetical protein
VAYKYAGSRFHNGRQAGRTMAANVRIRLSGTSDTRQRADARR